MKKKKITPKRLCVRTHAKSRSKERYNIELNTLRYKELSEVIGGRNKNGKSLFLKKQSLTKTWFAVLFDGILMCVVYNTKYKGVVTFLPKSCLLYFKEDVERVFKVDLEEYCKDDPYYVQIKQEPHICEELSEPN